MGYRSEVVFAIAPPLVDKFLAVMAASDEVRDLIKYNELRKEGIRFNHYNEGDIVVNLNYIKWYDDKGATTYEVVTDEMSKDAIGLLSYMKYDNGKITIDQTNDKYDYDTSKQWHSQSVGKSVVSYMTGHAICKGYIDSIDINWG